jgi:Tol biopolymer transport system component
MPGVDPNEADSHLDLTGVSSLREMFRAMSCRPMTASAVLAGALCFAWAGVSVSPAQSEAAFPGENGKIAFTNEFGSSLYSIDPDGSDPAVLADEDDTRYGSPTWSADGERLAFSVARDPGTHTYHFPRLAAMDPDGSNITPITQPPPPYGHGDRNPTWAPDGQRLAFVHDDCPEGLVCLQLYLVDADGSDEHRLTPKARTITTPEWSPSGEEIAYGTTGHRIFVADPEKEHPQRFVTDGEDPSWSPNGKRIAYFWDRATENKTSGMYSVRPDGTHRKRLTYGIDTAPAWSPDGEYIAFTRNTVGVGGTSQMHVWVMRKDGSEQEQLTSTVFGVDSQMEPDWQPLPASP